MIILCNNLNKKRMLKLTNKEREIMMLYWQHGPMFIRDLLEHYEEPRPHFNTLSTMVRTLEKNGYMGHKQYGSTYQYYPLISEQDFGRQTIANTVKNYFKGSYMNVVSSFVNDEKISVDELQALIDMIQTKEDA